MTAADGDPFHTTAKAVRDAIAATGSGAVVATVTSVAGSAYRRPGAKMLVNDAGEMRGAVTAGCLEPAVREVCATVRDTGRPQTREFDLTDDETWGLGLGCNGVIELLFEPRDDSWTQILDTVDGGAPGAVVTVLEAGPNTAIGDRCLVTAGQTRPVPDREPLPPSLVDRASETIERIVGTDTTTTVSIDGVRLLIDGLTPTPELLVFGSQRDITPLAALGRRAGFRVTVYAPRGLDQSAVPDADTVRTGHPSDIAEGIRDDHTYAVVMSHNLLDDRLAVESLLRGTSVPYIGVMGPRDRFETLCAGLLSDGVALTDADHERLAAPVGLDLGGGSPAEIAFSIVSEIIAVRNDRDGGRLRDRHGSIHTDRDVGTGDSP